MDSFLGYFEHMSLEKSHRQLENKNGELNEDKEKAENLNEELGNNLKTAKNEIVTLQKAIQEMQVC